MDEESKAALAQAGILIIQGFFSMMKASGKSDAEIDMIFQIQKEEFGKRSPNDLPTPPK